MRLQTRKRQVRQRGDSGTGEMIFGIAILLIIIFFSVYRPFSPERAAANELKKLREQQQQNAAKP